jgi:peptidyl-prolyl cis-trans isomerase A (cyclophilin A)/peptidyl-prolyl cis-trans isomerase B (cyclophilin B)
MRQLLLGLWAIAFCVTAQAANPQVELQTNKGTIVIELYPDKAPATVENFLRYVNAGYYNGTIFHRVIPGFMIQGGGYNKAYDKKQTDKPVRNEADNGLKNEIGTVAMARTNDPHSATSQFFINVANNGFLDYRSPTTRGYGYTVFGKVIKGMGVVNEIANAPTSAAGPFRKDVPVDMVTIQQAKIVEQAIQMEKAK